MRVALLAAFRKEIASLAREVGAPLPEKRRPRGPEAIPFVRREVRFAGHDLLLAVTGIGKVPAAACTQFAIDAFRPDAILLFGTAGALAPNLSPLDTIVVERAAAFDAGPGGPRWFETDAARIPALVAAVRKAARDGGGGAVLRGGMISGDDPVLDDARRRALAARFDALAVDMEAAAVVRAAALNGVPSAVVKTVTDRAGRGAEEEFKANLEAAVRISGAAALRYLEKEDTAR